MKVTKTIVNSIELEQSEIKLISREFDEMKDELKQTPRKRKRVNTENENENINKNENRYDTIFELINMLLNS